jgi:hypothetical protein
MKNKKGVVFSLISGGMEMCWLYGWAAFSMTTIMDRPFSFVGAIGAFVLAAILTHISVGKGWRIIQVGGLQAFGFACAAIVTLHSVYYSSYPLADTNWLFALFHQPRTSLEWIIFILILIWILLFWIGGYAQARRPRAYFTVCGRFDIGITAFFCLFLAKLVLLEKGGVKVDDPLSSALIFPFFLLSLLAIGMARIEHKVHKVYLPGYRGFGIIATFMATVILSAGAVILFFLPFLTAIASTGYRTLKVGAGFVLPIVERVLRYVFMGRGGMREEPAGSSPKPGEWDSLFSMNSPWMEFVEKVMKWGIKGVAVLLLLGAFGVIVYYLIKWLLTKTARAQGETEETYKTVPWFVRLWNALVLLYKRLLLSIRGYRKAAELYAVLLGWGQRSGFTHFIHETPLEFGTRLKNYFPRLKGEIDVIVSAFNTEVYGEATMSSEGMKKALSAWRALRSPRHWPLRLKTRFFSSGNGYPIS